MGQKHVNAVNQFDKMLAKILEKEKVYKLGNVTFEYLGPNMTIHDVPFNQWDNDAIARDLTREAFARKFVWLKDPDEEQPENIFVVTSN